MSILPIRLGQQKILALRVLCLVLFAGLFVGVGYLHVVLSVGPNPYLSYQGRLADQNGNLLTGNYYITFCIYASSSPATACTPPTTPSQGAIGVLSGSVLNSALWGDVEYFSATNTPDNHVVNGVFNAKLGSQSSFPATLFNANSQLWLGVNIYNGSSWDGQMSPLQEIVSSGYAINAGTLQGFSPSQTPGANNVVVLDSSGNLTINTGTKNIFGASVTSSTQYGLVDIGSGGFSGAGGNFSGSSSGTLLALNAPSGFGGNLVDLQTNGVSEASVDKSGNLTLAGVIRSNSGAGTNYVDYDFAVNNGNFALSATSNPTSAPTLGSSVAGALSATTYYVKYSWTTGHGETLASSEASLAVGANNVLTVTIPSFPISVTGANIYVSNTAGGGSGAETKQGSIASSGGTWTEPISGLVAGSALPGANNAGGSLVISNGTNSASLYHISSTLTLDNSNSGTTAGFLLANSAGFFELIPNGGPSSANMITSRSQTGGVSKDLYLTGNGSGNAIGTLTLNATSTVLTGNDNIFSAAANAGANYGVLNVGSGGFGGAGGNFSGSSSGTELAINAPSGYSGNIADFQKNGTSLFKLDNAGDLVLATSAPATTQYPLVALGTGGFSGGNGGFNGWGNGIYIGVNAASGFGGNFLDFQIAGQSNFALDSTGAIYEGGTQHSYNNINLDQITAPSIASTSCTAGGALVATTYYIKVTAVNSTGESSVSSESSQACGANTVLNVALGEFVRGETSANIYVSNTAGGGSGAETKQANFTTSQGTWVEPTSGLVAGAAMPSSNSTGGGIHFGTGSMGWLGDDKNGYTEFGVGSNTGLFSTSSTSGFLFYNTTGSPGGGRLFIQPGTSNGLNEIYSTNGAQSGVQNLTISGPSSIPVLTLDAVSTVFTGNDNIFQSAANAGANYGVVNIGSGGFSGGAGKFAGSTSGTLLALNAPNGYGGNLIDAQTNGSSVFKVDASGNLTVTGNIHSTATTYADVSSSGNQSIIFGSTGTFSQIPTMSVNLTCPANNTVVLALFNYNTFTSEPGVVAYALYRDGSRVQIASTNNISDPQSGPPVIIDPACPSGAHTYAMYAEILNTTGTITWNGPMQFQVKVLF